MLGFEAVPGPNIRPLEETGIETEKATVEKSTRRDLEALRTGISESSEGPRESKIHEEGVRTINTQERKDSWQEPSQGQTELHPLINRGQDIVAANISPYLENLEKFPLLRNLISFLQEFLGVNRARFFRILKAASISMPPEIASGARKKLDRLQRVLGKRNGWSIDTMYRNFIEELKKSMNPLNEDSVNIAIDALARILTKDSEKKQPLPSAAEPASPPSAS